MPSFSVPTICQTLEQFHQRATYGAVGDLVGQPAQSVMQPFRRGWRLGVRSMRGLHVMLSLVMNVTSIIFHGVGW